MHLIDPFAPPRGIESITTRASRFAGAKRPLDEVGIVLVHGSGAPGERGCSASGGCGLEPAIDGPWERRIEVLAKERVERDEEDLVRLYLTDIGQYPLLTKDDEVRLAQQIESGNAAREQLLAAPRV